jgi:dipeptidyl aminopeptidase/acylaminoacyl peptidase
VSEREGTAEPRQIVVVEVETSAEQVIPLPEGVFNEQGLAWLSAQALVLNHSAQPNAPAQLWRISYPDGRVSRLTNDLSSYADLTLSQDRTTLATTRRELRMGIWVGDGTTMEGTEELGPEPFIRALGSATVRWAGDRLLYTGVSNRRSGVFRLTPGAGPPEEIASNAFGGVATSDGRRIVFRSEDDFSLVSVDEDGRQPLELASRTNGFAAITSDDRFVVFPSNRTGIQSPWIVSIDGGEPTQLANLFVGPDGVKISPDGKAILFRSSDEQKQSSFVICDLPACTSRKTLPGAGLGSVHWTPDGLGIAYADEETRSNIWIQPLDGSPPRQLTRFTDGRIIADFAWSRDGRRLAISRASVTTDIVLFKGLR